MNCVEKENLDDPKRYRPSEDLPYMKRLDRFVSAANTARTIPGYVGNDVYACCIHILVCWISTETIGSNERHEATYARADALSYAYDVYFFFFYARSRGERLMKGKLPRVKAVAERLLRVRRHVE